MIGTYLENNLHDAQRRDCFVSEEVNTIRLHGLKPEEQAEANRVIQEAGLILNRPLPSHCYDPLYRKYYKVKNTTTTYAFGILEANRKEVRGTQGWSVQMALQLKKNVCMMKSPYNGTKGTHFQPPYQTNKKWKSAVLNPATHPDWIRNRTLVYL